ncbi:MAG TPA: CAP domain-containing protein [Bacteroidales bacterium]|nr:CAP domain-containing protein [Bacteroidales bacterium]
MRYDILAVYIFCLSGVGNFVIAQDDVWARWDPGVIEKANTAKDFEYYSDEEKKVVFFMNLARLDGPLFAETILDAYVENKQVENNAYLRSLYRDLKKTKGLGLLYPEEDLTSIAQGHANYSERTGHVGHKNFNKRFEPLMGNPYSNVGENCSYGYPNAVDIVVTLLIDDGVKNLGHRKNTLKPGFNSVGVAIRGHKQFRYNCVIDFGIKDRSSLNNAPI